MQAVEGKNKTYKNASFKPRRKKRTIPSEVIHVNPRINPAAQRLLDRIGIPEREPFKPDPFQTQSVEKILHQDVLVSAPTGSGKTWIAVEATKEYLARSRGIWYATPLKALSNSKYEEFGEAFGRENVGILTGDRKENHDAPVIVGTTEILRNQLYDSMQSGVDLNVDLVILDEAHYLGDADRGVVWEEVLIYLPPRVRILLLSATISNAHTVARWLTHIRGATCAVVRSDVRPVPLYALYRAPDGELTPFLKGDRLFPKVAATVKADRGRRRFAAPPPDMNEIVETLRDADLLPAIVFLKSRSDCDKAVAGLNVCPKDPIDGGFAETVREFLEPYPELRNQRQLSKLLTCRAGSHHAGQLPAWRLLIEKLMTAGHLEVIFSTSTVAAGVNFPARTVVLLQSDRFNGQGFVDMTSTEIHQMTGRAGRRGMDKAGFALVAPSRYLNTPLVRDLLLDKPEPLESRITVNFSMTLNLLLSHDPAGIKDILSYSFAAFRDNPNTSAQVNSRLRENFQKHLSLLQELNYVDEDGQPTYDGRWAAQLRLDHPLLIAEMIRSGELSDLEPEMLAALIAPFVTDKDKEIGISREAWAISRDVWKRYKRMLKSLKPLEQFMIARGFDVPSIMFWPSVAVFLWARGCDWEDLTEDITADEGDLAMLILRTADHLRQLCALQNEEPKLAQIARTALGLLMRSPLI